MHTHALKHETILLEGKKNYEKNNAPFFFKTEDGKGTHRCTEEFLETKPRVRGERDDGPEATVRRWCNALASVRRCALRVRGFYTYTRERERERAGRNHLCERRFCTGQAWLVCEQASHRVREVAARARARRSGSFERFAFVYIPCTCTCVQTCLYVCTRSTRYGGIRGEEGNT